MKEKTLSVLMVVILSTSMIIGFVAFAPTEVDIGDKDVPLGMVSPARAEMVVSLWNVSSKTKVGSLSLYGSDDTEGMDWNDDGTVMIEITNYPDIYINSYTVSDPYNITTATHVEQLSFSGEDGGPWGVKFGDNGNKLYMVGSFGGNIYEYDLSTPYDVSTHTYVQSYSVGDVTGMAWKDDGTKVILSDLNGHIDEYSLSTPWDVSTMTLVNTINSHDNSPEGIYVGDGGTKMYTIENNNDLIPEWDLSDPWNISSASLNQVADASGTNPKGIVFKPDGSKMWEVYTQSIQEYELKYNQQEVEDCNLFCILDNPLVFIALVVGAILVIGLASKSMAIATWGGYLMFTYLTLETAIYQNLVNVVYATLVLMLIGIGFKLWRLEGGGET